MSARYRKPYSAPEASGKANKPVKAETPKKSRLIFSVLKNVFVIIALNFLLSYYITATFFWNYDFRILRPRYDWFLILRFIQWTGLQSVLASVAPASPAISQIIDFKYPRVFTSAELAKYNGADPSLPVYLALNGSVYDVTDNRITYGPLGPYHHFAGRDASRAFVTGCFTTDLTHDLRGLDIDAANKDIQNWKKFFENSARYWYVGEVIHEPLTQDPPGPCKGPSRPRK